MVTNTWLLKDGLVVPYVYFTEVAVFYLLWCFIYIKVSNMSMIKKIMRRLPQEKRLEGNTRIVSSLHAITMTTFAIKYLMNNIECGTFVSILPVSSAFGVFDLTIVTLNYEKFKKGYSNIVIHHILLIFGPLVLTCNGDPHGILYLFETTVPLLDMSWYLYNSGQKNTLLFKINSVAGLVAFFIFRIINSFYIFCRSITTDYFSLIHVFIVFIFLLLNLNWFKLLVKLAIKH